MPLLLLCYQSYYLVRLKGAVVLQRVVQPMSFESGLYGIVCDAHWGIRESLRCSRLCVSTAQRLWRIGTCRSAPQAVIVVPDYKTPRITTHEKGTNVRPSWRMWSPIDLIWVNVWSPIDLIWVNTGADVGGSRCRCGHSRRRHGVSPGADVGKSIALIRIKCWSSPSADVGKSRHICCSSII